MEGAKACVTSLESHRSIALLGWMGLVYVFDRPGEQDGRN